MWLRGIISLLKSDTKTNKQTLNKFAYLRLNLL